MTNKLLLKEISCFRNAYSRNSSYTPEGRYNPYQFTVWIPIRL